MMMTLATFTVLSVGLFAVLAILGAIAETRSGKLNQIRSRLAAETHLAQMRPKIPTAEAATL